MKKLITTAITTMIVYFAYSQDLPLTAGPGSPLSGSLYTNGFIYGQTVLSNINLTSTVGAHIGYGGYAQSNHDSDGFTVFTGTGTSLIPRYIINTSGNNTWTGGGSFGGALTATNATFNNVIVNLLGGNQMVFKINGTTYGQYYANSTNAFSITNQSGTEVLNVAQSGALTGTNATFSGIHYIPPTSYFVGNTAYGYRFNNANDTENNFIIYDNGNTYTRGNVGIGTSNPDSKLTVAGKIHSQEVKVSINAGADFVFDNEYELKGLDELEKFIKMNKHLPEIASADEMKQNGVELGEMNIKLLQKIEELTLHLISQNKQLQTQESLLKQYQDMVDKQQIRIENLEAR